jgi:hypothetical protein
VVEVVEVMVQYKLPVEPEIPVVKVVIQLVVLVLMVLVDMVWVVAVELLIRELVVMAQRVSLY